ncbi:MAG: C40 family peptidase [Burkholderiales bacterium]|nr:C40 family peptidase [Burkholderiales bacterium]
MFICGFVASMTIGCTIAPPLSGNVQEAPEPARTTGAETAAGDEIALFALSTLGAPYAEGGASRGTGFDCSGLVAYVFRRAAQVELPRTTFELSRVGHRVAPEALLPGDLVFFDTQRRAFSHVGIYLGERRFIHAPSTGGTVRIEDMRFEYWARRFNGARRIAL